MSHTGGLAITPTARKIEESLAASKLNHGGSVRNRKAGCPSKISC
jgi:hypothetical protein